MVAIGKKVNIVDGPRKGLTGVVKNYTELGTRNLHLVVFDTPVLAEYKKDARGVEYLANEPTGEHDFIEESHLKEI